MEAAHQNAHLLKENVEASSSHPLQTNKLRFGESTPKRANALHAHSAPSGRKGLRDGAREKRRVLGDISNQQRSGISVGGGDDGVARKKKKHKSLKSGGDRVSEVVRVRKALSVKAVTPEALVKPVAATKEAEPAKVEEVEEIEHAYGGLLSPKPDGKYLASLREEMVNDIMNNKTRSLIDDLEPSEAFGVWDDADERAMLASGAAPSSWWSQATAEFDEDTSSAPLWNDADDCVPTEDEVPLPDELPEPSHDALANDDLLDDLLSVDVDAACQ